MFIGRKLEMEFFNSLYNSAKAEFVALFGRRRVGKTEFLTEFCKDKPTMFYTCREYTDKKQFEEFSDAVFSFDYSLKKKKRAFVDWNDAFSTLADIKIDGKLVVVIDEFPYMVKGDKSIPSILQVLWDHLLKECNIMLIVSGSSVSFMQDEILGSKNPLYGRMTAVYKMEPLPFDDAIRFFPNYSHEEQIEAYAILGGIPHYLKQFDPSVSLADNVKNKILTKGTVLFGEVDYILHQELREPASYITILEAVAVGCNRFGEISDRTQIESGKLSVYLSNLVELGLIVKELPALSATKETSKRSQGEYIIQDQFFRFWFAYAYPYLTALAMGQTESIWNNVIEKDLHHLSARAFENICIYYLWKQSANGRTPFPIVAAGRWWGKITRKDENGKPVTVNEEIDIVATDATKANVIFGECKFKNEPFDLGQLTALQEKRVLNGNAFYYLFSLGGFTNAVQREAAHSDRIKTIPFDSLFQL